MDTAATNCCVTRWFPGWEPAMTTIILIATLIFIIGAIAGTYALLAFVAWVTREEMDRDSRAAMDTENSEPSPGGPSAPPPKNDVFSDR
jgi:hypothetical protein